MFANPMKETTFRRLNREELESVREQFVKFLALNGISADHWTTIKQDEPARADALILQFSQVVFAGTIERVRYLIHRRPFDLRTYKTDAEKIYMRGILLTGETSVDFTKDDLPPGELFARLKTDPGTAKVYAAERAYLPVGRDQDIFKLLEEGALIDESGELFEALAALS